MTTNILFITPKQIVNSTAWQISNRIKDGQTVYFNPLHLVLLLFGLKSQLNEELLKFLIAVVDAKLLKTETHQIQSL